MRYQLICGLLLICSACRQDEVQSTGNHAPPPPEMRLAFEKLHSEQPAIQLQAMRQMETDPRAVRYQRERLVWISQNGKHPKVKEYAIRLLESVKLPETE